MSDAAQEYLAHLGIDVSDDELAHYGKKGMKWGVRKDDSGSSESGGSRWTADQKQKARNVAVVAGSIAVGAAIVAATVYARSNGGPGDFSLAPAGPVRLGASLPSQKGTAPKLPYGFFKDVLPGGKIQNAARDGVMSDAYRKSTAGKNFVDNLMKEKGNQRLALDPELRAFIKDAPNRILSDQKGWSNSLGKSLNGIQKEDAKFMADYIKNNVPKALGA